MLLESDAYASKLEHVTGLVLQFLESKSFFSAERALRAELAVALQRQQQAPDALRRANLFTSALEESLHLECATEQAELPQAAVVSDWTPQPTPWRAADAQHNGRESHGPSGQETPSQSGRWASQGRARPPARLLKFSLSTSEQSLRRQYGRGTLQERVVFHEPPKMSPAQQESIAYIAVPMLYNPNVNGLEDARDISVQDGTVIIGRYRIVAFIGKGSFSRVFQCIDLKTKTMVALKARARTRPPRKPCYDCSDLQPGHPARIAMSPIAPSSSESPNARAPFLCLPVPQVLHNDKDCLDAGLGEVRMLALASRMDPDQTAPIVRLLDFFYYKASDLSPQAPDPLPPPPSPLLHTRPQMAHSRIDAARTHPPARRAAVTWAGPRPSGVCT